MPAWAQAAAHQKADENPAVIETLESAKQTRQAASEVANRQAAEYATLSRRVLQGRHPSALTTRIEKLRKQAVQDRRYLAGLDLLSPVEAGQLVREHAAEAEAQRRAAEARNAAEARAARLRREDDLRRVGPSRDVGRRL